MTVQKNPLLSKEYFQTDCTSLKKQIVLHHTVSSKGKGQYVKDAFSNDCGKSKIAVPFVIDASGLIYELFDSKYFAYHLGITGMDNIPLCKKSIGIELVNEGGLIKKDDGKFYWFDGKYEYKGEVYTGTFRDYKYFAKYTNEQLQATAELIKLLCSQYRIKKDLVTRFDYDKNLISHEGIIMHCNVRGDKTDLSPAFDIMKLKELIGV